MTLNDIDAPDFETRLLTLHGMTHQYTKKVEEVCSVLAEMIGSGSDYETVSFLRFIILVKGSALTMHEWSEQNKTLGYIPSGQELKNFIELVSTVNSYNFNLAYYYNSMFSAGNYVLVKLPPQEDKLAEIDESIKGIWAFSSRILNDIMQEEEK